MSRSRASAKAAGARFERAIADYLAAALNDDRIDRRVKRGADDRGDIAGVRTIRGGRVVLELKEWSRDALPAWVDEAEVERGNDDAVIGAVIHKRRGVANPGEQFVTMTVDNFVRLLEGGSPEWPVVQDPMSRSI